MSEMVERVARAIAAKDLRDDLWDFMPEDGDDDVIICKNNYRPAARAAIEAMREPTKEMLSAAWATGCTGDNGGNERADIEDEWPAMIEEALK